MFGSAGYGEFRLGAGRAIEIFIAAFVGTGIGGCVILGWYVVEGATATRAKSAT